MTLENGTLLNGRYRIERVLGQGGMGAVYLAADESLGIHCAVKENLNPNPEAEKQFRREATLLASLRHHHLPRVTNHFILGHQQYLVMDFVEGEDLKERLGREGPLPEADVLRWASQICQALDYLHKLSPPVIHRDIKPANIKLNSSGEALLVDFGIAKAAAAGQKTTTGAVALTPGFAPPEQYGMGRTEPRTDQYALAATLYTLLTGQLPPDSMERLLGNVSLPPPQELRPDLSLHVAAALMRALELRPDDRFENVAAFKAAVTGETPLTSATLRASSAQPTVMQSSPATRVGAPPTVAAQPAETAVGATPTPPTVIAPRAGLPGRRSPLGGWVIPAGILGTVIVIGLLAFGLAGGAGWLAFLRPATATPTPTATQAVEPTQVPATPPPPTATATPPPPTQTPAPEPSPTDTPTPEPTPTPTPAGPPIGGGGRIAFVSNRDGKNFQVYTMNPDGSDVRQITFDPVNKWDSRWAFNGTQLAWSPDGTRLLYVAQGDSANGLDLWMINADGSNPQDITAVDPGRPAGDDYQPTWCSNGTIAFTSLRTGNVPQIFTMTLADPRPRNNSALRNSPREYDVSFFEPECTRLIFVTTVNGIPELWRYFPDLNSYRVFRSDIPLNASAEDPAVSPDGQWVAYTRRAPNGNEIILASVTNRLTNAQLTNTLSNSAPAWSPDGRYLVFVSKRDGNPETYRMLVSGGEQTNLTRSEAIDTDPAWQPAPKP